jgi:hypothetical protein
MRLGGTGSGPGGPDSPRRRPPRRLGEPSVRIAVPSPRCRIRRTTRLLYGWGVVGRATYRRLPSSPQQDLTRSLVNPSRQLGGGDRFGVGREEGMLSR